MSYKPGTLITLKDKKVYRASGISICTCIKCCEYYRGRGLPKPCSGTYEGQPFGEDVGYLRAKKRCSELFGEYQYPKLLP